MPVVEVVTVLLHNHRADMSLLARIDEAKDGGFVAIEPEDGAEFKGESFDVVATALFAESTEVAQVFSDLGGRHLELGAKLF